VTPSAARSGGKDRSGGSLRWVMDWDRS